MTASNKIDSASTEENRYVGSNGKPIKLAQGGTARIELTNINKATRPIGTSLLMTEAETGVSCAVDSESQKKTLAKADIALKFEDPSPVGHKKALTSKESGGSSGAGAAAGKPPL